MILLQFVIYFNIGNAAKLQNTQTTKYVSICYIKQTNNCHVWTFWKYTPMHNYHITERFNWTHND